MQEMHFTIISLNKIYTTTVLFVLFSLPEAQI
jgi:hypothetical protein